MLPSTYRHIQPPSNLMDSHWPRFLPWPGVLDELLRERKQLWIGLRVVPTHLKKIQQIGSSAEASEFLKNHWNHHVTSSVISERIHVCHLLLTVQWCVIVCYNYFRIFMTQIMTLKSNVAREEAAETQKTNLVLLQVWEALLRHFQVLSQGAWESRCRDSTRCCWWVAHSLFGRQVLQTHGMLQNFVIGTLGTSVLIVKNWIMILVLQVFETCPSKRLCHTSGATRSNPWFPWPSFPTPVAFGPLTKLGHDISETPWFSTTPRWDHIAAGLKPPHFAGSLPRCPWLRGKGQWMSVEGNNHLRDLWQLRSGAKNDASMSTYVILTDNQRIKVDSFRTSWSPRHSHIGVEVLEGSRLLCFGTIWIWMVSQWILAVWDSDWSGWKTIFWFREKGVSKRYPWPGSR